MLLLDKASPRELEYSLYCLDLDDPNDPKDPNGTSENCNHVRFNSDTLAFPPRDMQETEKTKIWMRKNALRLIMVSTGILAIIVTAIAVALGFTVFANKPPLNSSNDTNITGSFAAKFLSYVYRFQTIEENSDIPSYSHSIQLQRDSHNKFPFHS